MKQLKAKLTFAKDKVIEAMREGKEAPTEVQRRAAQVRQREERKYTVSGGEMRLIAMSARAKVCAMMGANWGCAWTRRCGRPAHTRATHPAAHA